MPSTIPTSVLLVDDQPRNLVALEAALSGADYALVTAHSGASALEHVLEQDFAAIVLDIHMPEMDGFEAASLIHARERSHSTPIIFLTADDRVGARVLEGYQFGAVDYLFKPFNPDILRLKIAVFVDLYRKTAALERRTTDLMLVSAALARRDQQVSALNSDLEARVADRTADLEAEVAERLRIEGTLRASEERFRSQYKSFPLPTYSWRHLPDDDFMLDDYNDAAEAIVGAGIREWLGIRASVRYAAEPDILAELRGCVAEASTRRRDVHYRYPDTAQERDLTVTYVFAPPQTVMIHTEDVTEKKHAERHREAMVQSEKLRALGQMASGIAHDLNQSLMLVASYSDLARQALIQVAPNLAEVEELLTTTTQAALDGGETVKRLLLFTRPAPAQEREPLDLGAVVQEAAQLTAPRWRDAAQAGGRSINLQVVAEANVHILGSAARLRELMTNLIFNAVDALPTGGTIYLRVMAEDGHAIVEVTDTGVGMSAEVQARVFEPFFTTKGSDGTGLGLAMVYGIVDQHGGQVKVHSAPGEGTTFSITFPLVTVSDAESPVTHAADSTPPSPSRILVVDDEPMMTRAVARMLKPAGHMVSVAGSAEEALGKLVEQTFDVVVSDMTMGAGMNGWELAGAINSRWPSTRFLLATGWGATIDLDAARTQGIESVLAKPYRLDDLVQALARTSRAA